MDNKETLEEAAERYTEEHKWEEQDPWFDFMEGAKWQQERSYSEEEVLNITQQLRIKLKSGVLKWQDDFEFDLEEWFEQFKKKEDGQDQADKEYN